jgi:hypothetical protein
MCEGGFGFIINVTHAMCVELVNITSNADGHANGLNLGNALVPQQTFKTCNLSYF